jgi:alkylation response protein AidB-like acyl-CoA dehydrogenase
VSAPDIAGRETRTDTSLHDYFEPRAADVDAGRASVRDGIVFLADQGLADAALEDTTELISTVARSDMTSAFSSWAHRMVLHYLSIAPASSSLRELLPDVRSGAIIGATAMAAGTAHYLSGAPVPISFRRRGNELVLDGRVPWASNLLPPFVAVTAAVDQADPERFLVVGFTDRTPGVTLTPYPDLLALQATGSSSVVLQEAVVPANAIVSDDLTGFVERILPPFLLLQSAFCRGLASRAVEEAASNLGPMAEVLRPDVERLAAEIGRADRRLARFSRQVDRRDGLGTRGATRRLPPVNGSGPGSQSRGIAVPLRDLLRLRLRWAHLAAAAVRLELASAGGRGYLRTGPTARRLREAAFLPIQAPTEVQLRWTLSRSA